MQAAMDADDDDDHHHHHHHHHGSKGPPLASYATSITILAIIQHRHDNVKR